MTDIQVRKLLPEEELEYLFEVHGENNVSKLYDILIRSSSVLHNRSQLLLSLATICLTISGFSGPKIAATGFFTRGCLAFGLSFILLSVFVIITGPLHLRWGTQRRAGTLRDSLIYLIQQRNIRTQKYHISVVFLILGLSGFVGSVIGYILQVR